MCLCVFFFPLICHSLCIHTSESSSLTNNIVSVQCFTCQVLDGAMVTNSFSIKLNQGNFHPLILFLNGMLAVICGTLQSNMFNKLTHSQRCLKFTMFIVVLQLTGHHWLYTSVNCHYTCVGTSNFQTDSLLRVSTFVMNNFCSLL